MREWLKKIIRRWPWPLTLNEQYDRQTRAILKWVCQPDSICIDVGCFRGDILRTMILYAPKARHIAFEPVPGQYALLQETFRHQADIHPFALGDAHGETTFHHVVTNPTYSGLRQRQYKGRETIQNITVLVRRLDEIVSLDTPITLIKIDVEGGEYDVLCGATSVLQQWHPYIIFEHGIGGTDRYGVTPGDVYRLLAEDLGYTLCLMGDFLKNTDVRGFSKTEFEDQYWKKKNCYFLAVYRPDKPEQDLR